MTKRKVWRYYCEFCRKARCHPSPIKRHEVNCFKNPNRIPYAGELTFVGRTGKLRDYGYKDCINGNWLEWDAFEDSEMPAWWPGKSGMIFDGKQWHGVPGYDVGHPTGAHGCAGGPAPFDIWPEFEGKPLNEFPARERLHHLGISEHGKNPTLSVEELKEQLTRLAV